MDREHGRFQPGPDHRSPGDKPRLTDPRLLTDLLAGASEGGFVALDVSGDSRPLPAEAPDSLPAKDDQDPPLVPEERGHDGALRAPRQVHGPRVPVHDDPVSRREDRHVNPVDQGDAAEDRARRDDRLRPLVHDRTRPPTPLREPVHDVRAHGAPLPVRERKDPARHDLPTDLRGGVNNRPRLPVDASQERHRFPAHKGEASPATRRDRPSRKPHDAYLRNSASISSITIFWPQSVGRYIAPFPDGVATVFETFSIRVTSRHVSTRTRPPWASIRATDAAAASRAARLVNTHTGIRGRFFSIMPATWWSSSEDSCGDPSPMMSAATPVVNSRCTSLRSRSVTAIRGSPFVRADRHSGVDRSMWNIARSPVDAIEADSHFRSDSVPRIPRKYGIPSPSSRPT